MLAVSSVRNQDESQSQMETLSIRGEDFVDFSDGNILESINFDDIFLDFDDGDPLSDLEMDPEIFADLSSSGGGEISDIISCVSLEKFEEDSTATIRPAADAAGRTNKDVNDYEGKASSPVSASSSGLNSVSSRGDESRRDESPSQKESDRGKIASKQSKNSQGKRKVKVDWTPELHRRFVQAVEQLGVDKAVPSRILEIMGIDCLTRHNIASHLQKYRSHRKHLLAREAEAATWNQRRHLYAVAPFPANGGKRTEANTTWLPPTMGFPPMSSMHQFRPLHVWGHPTMDPSSIHMWPKHLSHFSSPPPPPPPQPQPAWASPVPPHTALQPHDPPSHWQRAPNPTKLTPAPLCFPQPLATTTFAAPPVTGIPPHQAMYKVNPGFGVLAGKPISRPLFDLHPTIESIDAALGDILSKPGLSLPLGLKPPAIDSVIGELQRQGVPNIPIAHV